MGQLAIVNAPSSFTMIWAMIKPWISKETAAKVDILGSDYAKVLLELIDEENLPSTLGGKCTCAEHGGCHLSGAGPWMEGRVGWGPRAQAQAKLQVEQQHDAEIEILNSKLGVSKQITTTTLGIEVAS